jgi:hypothetical protein
VSSALPNDSAREDTLTARVAAFVCSDWQGPSVIPSHSAYTSQVAEQLGLTLAQAGAALRRAESQGLVFGSRGVPGEETYWMPA